MKTVLLPAQNRKDVKELPQEVKDGLDIVHVRYVSPLHNVFTYSSNPDLYVANVLDVQPYLGGHPSNLARRSLAGGP